MTDKHQGVYCEFITKRSWVRIPSDSNFFVKIRPNSTLPFYVGQTVLLLKHKVKITFPQKCVYWTLDGLSVHDESCNPNSVLYSEKGKDDDVSAAWVIGFTAQQFSGHLLWELCPSWRKRDPCSYFWSGIESDWFTVLMDYYFYKKLNVKNGSTHIPSIGRSSSV